MNNIKISIIIPIYNTGKYLEKCIKSVTEQSLKEIEIICINDGSTDNSLEILKKFQKEDNRIIIINKENGGSSSARNTALKIARGKYCLNIDSDDWIEQGYFKDLYERAEKDNLDITLSNIIFDFGENSKKNYILNDLDISNEKIITGKEYIKIFLKENFHGYTWNKLIKTELYNKNKIKYDLDIFSGEDVECILRLAYFASKIGKLNKTYYHYIQGENNGNRKIRLKSLKDTIKVFENLESFYKDKEKIFIKLLKGRMYPILLLKFLIYYEYYDKNKEYQEMRRKIINQYNSDNEFIWKNVNCREYEKIKVLFLKLLKNNCFNSDIVFKIFNILRKIKRKYEKK